MQTLIKKAVIAIMVSATAAAVGGWREREDPKAAVQPDLKDLPDQAAADHHDT